MNHAETYNKESMLSYVDRQFARYMIDEKLYLSKQLTFKKACEIMSVDPRHFREYSRTVLGGYSFRKLVHLYRIEEASEIWAADRSCTLRTLARRVGYRSAFVYLMWFVRFKW